jgi:cell wall assembly regulator SMI1
MPSSSDASWQRLERLLTARIPPLYRDLAPAADEAALDALSETTGLPLSESFRALYRGHDGQLGQAAGLFFGLNFLSAEEAAAEWRRWTSLIDNDPGLLTVIEVNAWPEGAVKAVYVDRGWIPIASDGSGNHLAADFAPGPRGTAGQIISFGTDEATRYVFAPSAPAFLDWCAGLIESSRAFVDADPREPGGMVLRTGKAGHLLDALPGILLSRDEPE